jgi:hypothetical protein
MGLEGVVKQWFAEFQYSGSMIKKQEAGWFELDSKRLEISPTRCSERSWK